MNSHSQLDIKELVTLSLLGAILFVMQVALRGIPNVELVSFLIFMYAKEWKFKALYPVYIFVILEGVIYGFGTWWIGYLYVWLVIVMVPIVLEYLHIKVNSVICALSLLIYGLIFGFLFAIEYAIIGGINAGWAYFLSGLPYDLIHGVANCVIGFVLYKPMNLLLKKIRTL